METIVVDAAELGVRLTQVLVAAGTDKHDDETYRRVCVDVHPGGIRLAATNRRIIVASWVPADVRYDGGLRQAAPPWDATYSETFVVDDFDGTLALAARKLAGLDTSEDEPEPAVLSIGRITDTEAAQMRGRRLFAQEGLVVTTGDLRALAPVIPDGRLGGTVDWRLIMTADHAEPWRGEMSVDRATATALARAMRTSMLLTTGVVDDIPVGWARIDGATTAVFVLQGGDAQISSAARKGRAKADDEAEQLRSVLARLDFEPSGDDDGTDLGADPDGPPAKGAAGGLLEGSVVAADDDEDEAEAGPDEPF